ncbi:metallophosphoesterase [Candidatus Magnetobacterium bavaricum]|uniref:Metallophosphoesterase n=1 Tax=Candidatus Magnetobacterium bavaricum TaxID=29290 RepID=A0A0F3GME4_9BACT|nr:metallophosphoesterase [Candidatus Magnetobacterium bavaricum]
MYVMLRDGLIGALWEKSLVLVVLLLFVGCSTASTKATAGDVQGGRVDESSLEEYLASKDRTADRFRFVVYGDSRGNGHSDGIEAKVNVPVITKINEYIVALDPSPLFVIHLGDLVMTGGTEMYDLGKKAMKHLNDAHIPYAVVVGNHELYSPYIFGAIRGVSSDMQKEYQRSFCTSNTVGPVCFPEDPKLPGYRNLAFAFEFGDSFFAILDTYYVADGVRYVDDISPEQLQWFREKAAGTRKRHKFVFAHKPIYSSGSHNEPPTKSMRELMNVLNDNHVDIYFAGHEHYYVRRKIEKVNDQKWPNGVTHIVDGGGGAPLSKPDPAYGLSACAAKYSFTVMDVTPREIRGVTYGFSSLTEDIKPIDKFCLLGDGKPCPGSEAQDKIVEKCS